MADHRKDELFAIALAARRRDSKATPQGARVDRAPGVPTPEEDHRSDVIKNMTPEERAVFRKFLESN